MLLRVLVPCLGSDSFPAVTCLQSHELGRDHGRCACGAKGVARACLQQQMFFCINRCLSVSIDVCLQQQMSVCINRCLSVSTDVVI